MDLVYILIADKSAASFDKNAIQVKDNENRLYVMIFLSINK